MEHYSGVSGAMTIGKMTMELARATRTRRAMAQLASVIGLAVSISTPAAAEIYPSRPIKIISPFSAGSAPDTVGRLVAQQLSDRLRQSVTIENRPGAGTTIATKAAASAEPDGYTLLQINAVMAYSTVLYPNAGYDPVKSFSPVAAFGTQSHFLFTPESVQADSIEGLLTTARATSGALNIGFPLGSPPQVLGELFKAISGAPLNSVPYRQVPQLIADLLAGRLHANFGAGAGNVSLVHQGKLKAMVYTGLARHPALPRVPTVIEAGFPQLALDPSDWTGLVAPAGTPADVIDTLTKAVNGSLTTPEIRASLAQLGGEPKIVTAQAFAIFVAAEARKWPPLLKAAGMKPE
jgi:tripartite-type tricarboxylate transporter receptor subunit TctC